MEIISVWQKITHHKWSIQFKLLCIVSTTPKFNVSQKYILILGKNTIYPSFTDESPKAGECRTPLPNTLPSVRPCYSEYV